MLIAYEVAIELIRELRPLVEQIRKHDNNLAKQLVDAMNSTTQNLAEGEVHRGGNKRAKFDIAHGEANEVKASLDLAVAWGYASDDSAARAKLRRLLALCWGHARNTRAARAFGLDRARGKVSWNFLSVRSDSSVGPLRPNSDDRSRRPWSRSPSRIPRTKRQETLLCGSAGP